MHAFCHLASVEERAEGHRQEEVEVKRSSSWGRVTHCYTRLLSPHSIPLSNSWFSPVCGQEEVPAGREGAEAQAWLQHSS